MTIDFSKPLELLDGTPLVLRQDVGQPDEAGDYFLCREDGEDFTFEQAPRFDGDYSIIVGRDGAEWGGSARKRRATPIVRNRIEAPQSKFQPQPEATVTSDGGEPIYQFFAYSHLPITLQAVSKPFHELATLLLANLPRNPERTVALRKLLESKDAAVRAAMFKG